MRRGAQLGLGLGAALLLATALLLFVRIPPDQVAVRRWAWGGGEQLLNPGIHLRLPLLHRVDLHRQSVDPFVVEATDLPSGGGWISVRCRVAGQFDPDVLLDPTRLAAAGSMAATWRAVVRATLRESVPFQDPARLQLHGPGPESVDLVARRLAQAGLRRPAVECEPAAADPGRAPPGLPEVRRRSGSVRTGTRVVIIGLDGADWSVMAPLLDRGELPHLAGLLRHGLGGPLRSFEPVLSPLLWTTVATGMRPDRHGILDFLVIDPLTGAPVPIGSDRRLVPAIWNIASDFERTTSFVGWWATWPAETIRGTMVSDQVAYSLFPLSERPATLGAAVAPAEAYRRLRRRVVAPESISLQELRRFVDLSRSEYAGALAGLGGPEGASYRDPVAHLIKIIASTRTYHGIALDLLEAGQPDLLGIYYQGIDEVSHRFAHFMAPRMAMVTEVDHRRFRSAVDSFYRWQDELIGELLAAAAPDTLVVVLSDHGFLTGRDRPAGLPPDINGKPDRWHRLDGVLILSGGPLRSPGQPFGDRSMRGATLYDIAPTVLYALGLPVSREMPGVPRFDAFEPAFLARTPLFQVDSFGPRPGADRGTPRSAAIDEEMVARLRSLGYVGGGGAAGAGDNADGDQGLAATYHANRAYLLLDQGDPAAASAEVELALAARSDYLPALVLRARIREESGDLAGALQAALVTLQEGMRQNDRQPGNLLQIAALYAGVGDPRGGLVEMERFGTGMGDDTERRLALGELRLALGDAAGAEREFRAAVDFDPAADEAVRRLFFLLVEGGDLPAAEQVVGAALSLAPESIVHRNLLGLLLIEQGDVAGGEQEFRAALRLSPDDPPSLANLGGALGRAGRLEEAVEVLRRAAELDPDNIEALVNLAAALGRLGRLDEIVYRVETARARGLESAEILNALGLAYHQTGRARQAAAALRASLGLEPDQPQIRALLESFREGRNGGAGGDR